ncbi:FemAB family XrtA/PEP-CTERM system-associated protein [Sphingomonas sp. Tas61C01]|uniref:FemAB family XrtA/PEP-CTERM system-associated protein n=1 Tax=Sphingomonas sp. Tas61C01 TaxID=3458297 RepID=UPI00403E4509
MIELHPPVGIREADRADHVRVDAFVREQRGATPFHLPAWSEAVALGCGQRARYLIAERANGDIAGVLPLTDVRSPLFGRALVSTGFGVGGGVLGDATDALAAGAIDLARRIGTASVELRGGALPAEWAIDDGSYLGFVKDLAADDEAELKAVPRKQRAEIRRAATLDLSVSIGRGECDLADHYRVYAESVRNLGTPVFPRALFRQVLATMDADILTVRSQGAAVASVLSLYLNGTVYPYWGGGTAASRSVRAHEHLYFSLMRHARERGCTRFDFGRSKTGTGAAAFKKNWGFTATPLTYARHSDGPARTVNPLDPKYALMVATWKRLPLWLANRLGPPIARGLG